MPEDFLPSSVIPIPKKRGCNSSASENFRGIALSSVFGKIFDNIIFEKFQSQLNTCDLQFGFKSTMCTMVLKETIAYYVKNRSSVFCTFLDASKAFDRVHYCKLFRLLIERGIPACIRTLVYMYSGHSVRVLWAGISSNYFQALNGVKQGGVISPILFCIYIDNLLKRLPASGVGSNFLGALAYAVAPTPSARRKVLMICDMYASQYDIIFNAQKSKFLVVCAACQLCFFSSVAIKLRTWTPFHILDTLLILDLLIIKTY